MMNPVVNTRTMVIQLRIDNPEWTLNQIGIKVNRTRERVRQILVKARMEPRSAKSVQARQPSHLKTGQPCKQCETPVPYVQTDNKKNGRYPRYCSPTCRQDYYRVERLCDYCEKVFTVRKVDLKTRRERNKATYCSHSCRSNGYWAIAKNEKPNIFEYSTYQPMTQNSKKDNKNDDKTNGN